MASKTYHKFRLLNSGPVQAMEPHPGHKFSELFNFRIKNYPSGIWSDQKFDEDGLIASDRIINLLSRLIGGLKFSLMDNPFSTVRLGHWANKKSKITCVNRAFDIQVDLNLQYGAQVWANPHSGFFNICEGVYLLQHSEEYLGTWNKKVYIVFDENHGASWGEEEIRNFILKFSKELYDQWTEDYSTVGDKSAFDSLFLPDQVIKDIREDIEGFLCSKKMYEEDLKLPWKRGYMFIGPPGNGKCLGKDTPVLMFDGTIKLVQNIKRGDLLMGDDSLPRSVLNISSGKEDLYRIIPKKGDPYIVNSSHILSLKESGGKGFQKGKIRDIELLDYLKLPNHQKHHLKGFKVGVKFGYKKVPFDPYMLGYWLGDGNSLNSDISTADKEIVSFFDKRLKKYDLFIERKNKLNYDYYISTKKLGADPGYWGNRGRRNYFRRILQDLNLIKNKHIPYIYKCNSRSNRLKLLAGILDADGNYQKHCRQFEVCFKSKQLSEDLVFLSRSLGFAAYSKPCIKKWTSLKYNGEGQYFRIIISGNGLESIPTIIPRKKALKRNQKKDALVSGIKVEKVGMGDYYGFELDGNGRFLLGDFTVTHNTLLIRSICKYYGLEHFDIKSVIDNGGNLNMNAAMDMTIDCLLYPNEARPKVCVLEDIDKFTAFQSGACSEQDYGAISLHSLLRGLDGVDTFSDVILIATTNFPDVLHEAIAGRPGRFDKIYSIELPTTENIRKLLEHYNLSFEGCTSESVSEQLKGSSMAFVAEFVKLSKMKFKRNRITAAEADVILEDIKRHKKLSQTHFKEEKSFGFKK